MAVDTSAALEQLLPRFEALRSGGLIEVLAIQSTKPQALRECLPGQYRRFASPQQAMATGYGHPSAAGRGGISFRLLGEQADIRRFLSSAIAAGSQLRGRLAQAHLVKPNHLSCEPSTARQYLWLISMFTAGERGRLLSDGLAGERWFQWNPEAAVLVAEQLAQHYRKLFAHRGPAGNGLDQLLAEADPSVRYAVIEDVVEASVALLRWLAESRDAKPASPAQEPKQTTFALLEALWSTAAGREQLIDAGGRSQKAVGELIGRSASSVNGSPFFQKTIKPEVEKEKAARAMARDHRSRFGYDNSDLGSV